MPMYYKNAQACLLVYDATNIESFESLSKWIKDIEENRTLSVLIVLVANKCDDTEREEVSLKQGID